MNMEVELLEFFWQTWNILPIWGWYPPFAEKYVARGYEGDQTLLGVFEVF
jgi:hypothetical protein